MRQGQRLLLLASVSALIAAIGALAVIRRRRKKQYLQKNATASSPSSNNSPNLEERQKEDNVQLEESPPFQEASLIQQCETRSYPPVLQAEGDNVFRDVGAGDGAAALLTVDATDTLSWSSSTAKGETMPGNISADPAILSVSSFSVKTAACQTTTEAIESPTEKLMNSSVVSLSSSSDGQSANSSDSGRASDCSNRNNQTANKERETVCRSSQPVETVVSLPRHERSRTRMLNKRQRKQRRNNYFAYEDGDEEHEMLYEFDIPATQCGLFIGKRGVTVNSFRDRTNTSIVLLYNHQTPQFETCRIVGTKKNVSKVLRMIEKKFPDLDTTQTNADTDMSTVQLTDNNYQLPLPEGVTFDVVVSSVLDVNRVSVQQITHGSYLKLEDCYADPEKVVPQLPRPIDVGAICVAPMYKGWYRVQVIEADEANDEYAVRYLDYGGVMKIAGCQLKQIRSDFMMLPFIACECYLADVTPLEDTLSSQDRLATDDNYITEACTNLEQLVSGTVLKAKVVGYNEYKVPYVFLHRTEKDSESITINDEMVQAGFAKWIVTNDEC